uniref:PPM-type phosphatase domain-containing protein n=1 Tax=Pseudo-nitzschia australis TaxID=44445 RepID=A0A7S4AA37_9STRA|mmetsp:Transcript_249/g.624  ORF Transcript_249/g.624 Transcript_249/m.624 type:complete len:492 (+) Transcript_249:47-1522(+)
MKQKVMMIQSKPKLWKKSSHHPCLPSLYQKSTRAKGCVLVSFALVVYLNFRFTLSVLNRTVDTIGNQGSRSVDGRAKQRKKEFLSLPSFPYKPLTAQSTIQEWDQHTQIPMTGFYRYSSIATLQLPTSDLQQLKTSRAKGVNPGDVAFRRSDDVVVLTRKGHKFNPEDGKSTPNQDRVLVLSKQDDSFYDRNHGSDDWWMGLFDGHGYHGHAVSQYVSSEFTRRINKDWENESTTRPFRSSDQSNIHTMVKDTLRKTFLEINKSIPSRISSSSGCTGISVLKRGNSMYISNVGDSVAFVASYDKSKNAQNGVKIIYSASSHKPDTPRERKRIEASGGRIQDPIFEGASARLIIPVLSGSQMFETGLAMSRSFGDHDGLKVGLSDEPDTDVLDLRNFDKNQEYIVVAVTDGLVDYGKLSEQEVALTMAQALSTKQNDAIDKKKHRKNIRRSSESSRGIEAAAQLILKASRMWDDEPGNYRDDISIVAHKLMI